MLDFIDYTTNYKAYKKKEADNERTISYYIREMSAKEERIRNQKKKYETQILELNDKIENLEKTIKRLKSKRA